MKLEDQATTHRSTVAKAPPPPRSRAAPSPLVADVLDRLTGHGPRSIACARGRLGLMGGVSDYAGALVLHSLVAPRVCVGVRRHESAAIRITPCAAPDGNGAAAREFKLADIATLLKREPETWTGRDAANPSGEAYVDCILGAVVEACRAGWTSLDESGFTLAMASELNGFNDVGVDAAMICATLAAFAQLLNRSFDVTDGIELCRRVQNRWTQWPVDGSDAACVLQGVPGNMGSFRGSTGAPADLLCMEPLTLVGLDSGTVSPDAREKYTRVRTASFMGRFLIERIVAHESNDPTQRNVPLAAIPVQDYVTRFRDRLPTRIKGRDFLELFGETGDPLTRIEPDFLYKVRSRTEHHVYEHDRAQQWIKTLNGNRCPDDPVALKTLGELMSASHWSYGQRCGLGGIETDLLANLVQRAAVSGSEFFGAKISGRGSGGVVTVLMRDTDRAWEELERICRTYRDKTDREARLLPPPPVDALPECAQLF